MVAWHLHGIQIRYLWSSLRRPISYFTIHVIDWNDILVPKADKWWPYFMFHNSFQIPEIVTFMLLLIVFILAYGVSSQAIIDPYREFSAENFGPLLFSIIFLPYYQMYGELQLERWATSNYGFDSDLLVIVTWAQCYKKTRSRKPAGEGTWTCLKNTCT